MTPHPVALSVEERRSRTLGWGASFVIVALAGIPYLVLGDPALYMVLIPVAAAGVAMALYTVSRPLYVAFALWVWMFTPLVRRLLDYAMGAYTESNLVMTTPFAVGGIGILGLVALLAEENRSGLRQAFLLVFVALLYGATVGLLVNGAVAMTTDLFDWGLPVVLAALLLVDWRQYPQYKTVILRSLVVTMGLMGLYGLYQFFVLPPWDRMWMESVDMTTIGAPVPGRVRLFGPVNSPLPYAMTLAVGLLGLFALRGQGLLWGSLALASAVPASIALLLTSTRTAWGALIVGFFFILLRLQARSRLAILVYVVVASAAAVPLMLTDTVADQVVDRTSTLTQLDEDRSAENRAEHFQTALPLALSYPSGGGLGAVSRAGGGVSAGAAQDSGILTILFTLGVPGTLIYGLGLALLFLWVWKSVRGDPGGDRMPVAMAGAAVAVLSTMPFGNMFSGVTGVYLWGFLAMALAGIRYYSSQEEEEAVALAPPAASPSAALAAVHPSS
jgi:hypothetical protein